MAACQPLPQREGMEAQASLGEGFVVRKRCLADRQQASQKNYRCGRGGSGTRDLNFDSGAGSIMLHFQVSSHRRMLCRSKDTPTNGASSRCDSLLGMAGGAK